jgi:hypothetical protein
MNLNFEDTGSAGQSAEAFMACPGVETASPRRQAESPAGVAPHDPAKAEVSELELENSGLRRLVVELLEKNQQLRQQVLAAKRG